MKQDEITKRSPIILTTSSNLLGFCFIVLTSRQISSMQEATVIDDITAGSIAIFMTSSLLSFLAMRNHPSEKSDRYEKFADVIFLIGLFVLFIAAFLVAFNVIA